MRKNLKSLPWLTQEAMIQVRETSPMLISGPEACLCQTEAEKTVYLTALEQELCVVTIPCCNAFLMRSEQTTYTTLHRLCFLYWQYLG